MNEPWRLLAPAARDTLAASFYICDVHRLLKGNVRRENFDASVERAHTAQALEATKSVEKQAALIEKLREEWNRQRGQSKAGGDDEPLPAC